MLNFCGLFRSISSPSQSCLSFRWSPRPGRRSLLLLTTFSFRDFTGIPKILTYHNSNRPRKKILVAIIFTPSHIEGFSFQPIFILKNLLIISSFRAFYIVNWYYRYTHEGFIDKIAVVSGCVQTVLYMDFFYLYITKGRVDSNHITYVT